MSRDTRSPAPCANTENRANTSVKQDTNTTQQSKLKGDEVYKPDEVDSAADRLRAALWAVPIYVDNVKNYDELGSLDGITENMRNLVQCVRRAASICNEMNALRASNKGDES